MIVVSILLLDYYNHYHVVKQYISVSILKVLRLRIIYSSSVSLVSVLVLMGVIELVRVTG